MNDTNPHVPASSSQATSLSLSATAGIFFALGFIVAFILFSGSGAAPLASSNQNEVSAVRLSGDEQNRVDAAIMGTLIALTPTATPPPTPVPVADTFTVDNPVQGNIDAPVKIVEFTSYTCGFCGRFRRDTLPALQQHYGDMVVFISRDFPRSDPEYMLNIANRCAAEQDRFWAFSNLFWQNQVSPEPLPLGAETTIASFAEQAGIEPETFAACRANEAIASLVTADRHNGILLGVSATPTFFINGIRVVGAKPLAEFLDIIDAELRANGIQPPARA